MRNITISLGRGPAPRIAAGRRPGGVHAAPPHLRRLGVGRYNLSSGTDRTDWAGLAVGTLIIMIVAIILLGLKRTLVDAWRER